MRAKDSVTGRRKFPTVARSLRPRECGRLSGSDLVIQAEIVRSREVYMRYLLVGIVSLFAVLGAVVQPSEAAPRPWCLQGSGGMSCLFQTHRQCLASSRGVGGACVRNPAVHRR